MKQDSVHLTSAASGTVQAAPSDRELLELAAKAAGIVGKWERRPEFVQERWYFNVPYDNQGMLSGFEWNPLTDDGDALRLAVKLRLHLQIDDEPPVNTIYAFCEVPSSINEPSKPDPYAATRRAIVRAAAAIARNGSDNASPTNE